MCCQDIEEVIDHLDVFSYIFEESTNSDVIYVIFAMLVAMLFVLRF
jgi:hypothetical protein